MIIGLSGYSGSGKDEVAKILVRQGFIRIGIADGVKDFLYDLNPTVTHPESGLRWSLRRLVNSKGWDVIKDYPEVRGLLQRTATATRAIDLDFWIDVLQEKLNAINNYIIPDVRYPNEREWIMSQSWPVWRVNRPNLGPKNDHESETALDGYFFDAYITNSKGLDYLERQVSEVSYERSR